MFTNSFPLDIVTKNMRIRRDVVGEKRKQEKKESKKRKFIYHLMQMEL